jgi:hypothetical protein
LTAFFLIEPGVDQQVPVLALNKISIQSPKGIPGQGNFDPKYVFSNLLVHKYSPYQMAPQEQKNLQDIAINGIILDDTPARIAFLYWQTT